MILPPKIDPDQDRFETDQPELRERRDEILEKALPHVAFDGWTMELLENAAQDAGYEASMAPAVFPRKVTDALMHFMDWADRKMLERIKDTDPQDMRVRDRIRLCVWERAHVLRPYKEAVRQYLSYCMVHPFLMVGSHALWRSCDRIWNWAGDDATDYNYYTKRGLLSSVITATTLVWLNDDSDNHEVTGQFLDQRIDNVLQFGKAANIFKGKIEESLKGRFQ